LSHIFCFWNTTSKCFKKFKHKKKNRNDFYIYFNFNN
jgi:hypothetical protein